MLSILPFSSPEHWCKGKLAIDGNERSCMTKCLRGPGGGEIEVVGPLYMDAMFDPVP
jgi:hypothetical protein